MTHENSLPPNLYDLSIPTCDYVRPGRYGKNPTDATLLDQKPKDYKKNVAANIDEFTARVTKSKHAAPDETPRRSHWLLLLLAIVPALAIVAAAWLYGQGWRVYIP